MSAATKQVQESYRLDKKLALRQLCESMKAHLYRSKLEPEPRRRAKRRQVATLQQVPGGHRHNSDR